MSLEIGIVGLPKSGRTTIFNALTGSEADTGKYTREGTAPHVGVAEVPEERLATLTDMLNPKKVVAATATYVDIGASVKDMAQEKGIGGQLLAQLSNVDTLINVVRSFEDDSVPHVEGSLDVERDIANMELELAFSDMAIIERRLHRIDESLKGAKADERQGLMREQELLARINDDLGKDKPVREQQLTEEGLKVISNFQFLTAKPILVVVNIGEDQLDRAETMQSELGSNYQRPNCRLLTVCGKVEMELAQLDDDSAKELSSEFGIKEPGADRIIRLSYELLGFISFFTTVSDEVKAWSVKKGSSAVKAAGKIHSDMERGFIRAEVISHDDLVKCGSMAEAKKQGLLRLEGKEYIVQDGDVITFLFNV